MASIVAYIATKERSRIFKKQCNSITDMKIGIQNGLGTIPDYYDILKNTICKFHIDYVIFDMESICEMPGEANKLIQSLTEWIKDGTSKKTKICLVDPAGHVNAKGKKIFEDCGLLIVDNPKNISPSFKKMRNFSSVLGDSYADSGQGSFAVTDFDIDNIADEIPSIQKAENDFFAGLEDVPDELDPFAEYDDADDYDTFNDEDSDDAQGIFDIPAYNESEDDEEAYGFTDLNEAFDGDFSPFDNIVSVQDPEYLEHDDGRSIRKHKTKNVINGTQQTDDIQNTHYDSKYAQEEDEYDYNDEDDKYTYVQIDSVDDIPEAGIYYPVLDHDPTDGFTGYISHDDMAKLLSIPSPDEEWDYSQINGTSGKRLFGKKKNNGIGSVDEEALQNSQYILEQQQKFGYYEPPEDAQIIISFSVKGGTGKTNIATGIGAQLNFYFNKDTMMGKTTVQHTKVLVLSLDEFDDISVNEIGDPNATAEEKEEQNIISLKSRIEECGGNPTWEDIQHCFSVSPENFVFYLPKMSKRQQVETGASITTEDYKKIIEVCSKFFQFIILDSPDSFDDFKDGLMRFALNVSDVVVFVIEATAPSTTKMADFFEGIKADSRMSLSPDKCILAVNKYANKTNPYLGYAPTHPQIDFKYICEATRHYFKYFVDIPLTEQRSVGHILFGTDPKVKIAIANLSDDVLKVIDETAEKKKSNKKNKHRK